MREGGRGLGFGKGSGRMLGKGSGSGSGGGSRRLSGGGLIKLLPKAKSPYLVLLLELIQSNDLTNRAEYTVKLPCY